MLLRIEGLVQQAACVSEASVLASAQCSPVGQFAIACSYLVQADCKSSQATIQHHQDVRPVAKAVSVG